MTLAIVLVGVVLYLGLAIMVARFCGLNSAWERAAREAMRREAAAAGSTSERAGRPSLGEPDLDLGDVVVEPQRRDRAAQPVH